MQANDREAPFDVIVVGGSYAGLSAAMQLARARRRVLVIDAGVRRNRFASAAHGFLGQDGRAPDLIAAEGRAQVMAYPDVRWEHGVAVHAERADGGFVVRDAAATTWRAQYLVLAVGVTDELPAIDGLAERWGRSVFHCPYCHGYELERGRIGALVADENTLHHAAMMLPEWGTVTLLTNGAFVPDEQQKAELAARGVGLDTERVVRITDAATVELADGRRHVFDGLLAVSRTRLASPLAGQLGCAFEAGPQGACIRTDATKESSVPGVFACGDAARHMHSIAFAVGDGAMAGIAVHRALLFR